MSSGSGPLLRPQTPATGDATAPGLRIVVASAIRLYREGLANSLAAIDGFDVVGVVVDVHASLDALEQAQPDVVLLDASAPRPVEAVRALARAVPRARVVALAVVEVEEDVIPLAEAGVGGYLTVDQSLGELAEVVAAVARGDAPSSPALSGMLLRRVGALARERARESANGTALTTRERQILELIERGLSNKEIARDLCIGVATVKNHVHNILDKLDVPTRGAAAARARI